jgi:predicted ribosomally synthesized peptide with SipW-like signal peptide
VSGARRLFWSAVVVGLVGLVAGAGTYAAFSKTTGSTGNTYASGTVYLSDNDAGSSMWSVSNQLPGGSVTKCIRVTYTGTLDADVKLYTTSGSNGLDPYLDMTVDKGSMPTGTTFPACTGFSSESTIFSGTVQNFKSNKTAFGSGVGAYPGAQTKWSQNDTLVYRVTVTLQNNTNAQGLSCTLGFTWEARNQ